MIEYSTDEDDRNFLQKYGWYFIILFITIHYLKRNVFMPILSERQRKQNYKQATDPQRVAILQEQMIKVRLEQQRQAELKSNEAKEQKKLKKIQRLKETKVDQPLGKTNVGGGHRLGSGDDPSSSSTNRNSSSSSSTSYNPLMPSTGHAGPSYRPSRRSRPGGGG